MLAPTRARQLHIEFDDQHQVWHLTAPGTALPAAGEKTESSPPAVVLRAVKEREAQGRDTPRPIEHPALLANNGASLASASAGSGNTVADDSRAASSSSNGAGSTSSVVADLSTNRIGDAYSGTNRNGHGESDGESAAENNMREGRKGDGGGSAAAGVIAIGFVEEDRRAAEVGVLAPEIGHLMMARDTCANRLLYI